MKAMIGKRPRIQRTFLPSVNLEQQPIQRTPHIKFFQKIQGNRGLLQKYDFIDDSKNRTNKSFFERRFRLSKRLQQLSRVKPKGNSSVNNMNKIDERRGQRNSLKDFSKKGRDDIYDLQIANLSKTINGTQIGALSSRQILDQMEHQEQQHIKQTSFYGFDKLVKRMDSEFNQESYNQSKIRRLGETQRQSSGEGARGIEKKIQMIYEGDKGFLQKYRDYQISLLEKIPSYRSRKLTLDCKNDWRI